MSLEIKELVKEIMEGLETFKENTIEYNKKYVKELSYEVIAKALSLVYEINLNNANILVRDKKIAELKMLIEKNFNYIIFDIAYSSSNEDIMSFLNSLEDIEKRPEYAKIQFFLKYFEISYTFILFSNIDKLKLLEEKIIFLIGLNEFIKGFLKEIDKIPNLNDWKMQVTVISYMSVVVDLHIPKYKKLLESFYK